MSAKKPAAKKVAAKKAAKKAAPTGRPSKRTPAVIHAIVEGLANGEPLAVICRRPNMPGVTTVWEWQQKDPALSESIARAREAGFDMIAMRVRETARERGDSTGDVQRDKLIVETDLKLLAKWDPKRYGDRTQTEISGPNGGPIASVQAFELPAAQKQALLGLISSARAKALPK